MSPTDRVKETTNDPCNFTLLYHENNSGILIRYLPYSTVKAILALG